MQTIFNYLLTKTNGILAYFPNDVETKTPFPLVCLELNHIFFSFDSHICCCFEQAHLEACTFKMVACTNEHCLEQVKRKDLEQHVTNTCEWRIIECEYCEEPHPKRYLQVNKTKNNRRYFPLRVFCKMPLIPSTTDLNIRDENLFHLIFDLDV